MGNLEQITEAVKQEPTFSSQLGEGSLPQEPANTVETNPKQQPRMQIKRLSTGMCKFIALINQNVLLKQ